MDTETNSSPPRFSKKLALHVLDTRALRIAETEKFDRSKGTSQLKDRTGFHEELIRRAVEYGRMRAFEQFAESIEEGFKFEGAAQPSLERLAAESAASSAAAADHL